MTVSSQTYRNNRKGFYTDFGVDSNPIGTIIATLPTRDNSFDHNYIKSNSSSYPAHTETAGDAYQNGNDPAYTHPGYLYCDGSEYNISDFPALYEMIGNDYGGESNKGIKITNVGSGYTTAPTISFSSPTSGTNPLTATGEVTIATGSIDKFTLQSSGAGYEYSAGSPNVTITVGEQWETGKAYSTGDQVFNVSKVYTATSGGTSGATAPTHTTGTVSDGTVSWSYAGVQATVIVLRLNPQVGSIAVITQANVLQFIGDQNMGTFKVPDLIAKKVVGNAPVYGQNSPNIGNSSLGVGTTGGAWYLDQGTQDNYFSLGRIVTTGYENVTDTVSCDIIGEHTVTVSMRDQKLSGVPQHAHTVYHSIPGDGTEIAEISGDRYLNSFRSTTKGINQWEPTNAGTVLRHTHGLMRAPMTDPEVATYDAFDFLGGAGGAGSTQNPRNAADTADTPYSEQKYLASGGTGAGSWVTQTSVEPPVFQSVEKGDDVIGGRETIVNPGKAIYDWSFEKEYTNAGTYTENLASLGNADEVKFIVIGGGGSGGAGTTTGNDGNASTLVIGNINISAGGGKKGTGAGAGGDSPGVGGVGGTATSTGSFSITGTSGQNGVNGTGTKLYVASQTQDPNTGGAGGISTLGTGGSGSGSSGENVKVGGQGTSSTIPMTTSGSFQLGGINNVTAATFTIRGGRGGRGYLGQNGWGSALGYPGNQVPGNGVELTISILGQNNLDTFTNYNWNVKLGGGAGDTTLVPANCGNYSQSFNGMPVYAAGCADGHSANGGRGGHGWSQNSSQQFAMGGGGGAATVLYRNSVPVAGAGGGGGMGSSGYDNGAGTSGVGPPPGGGAVGSLDLDAGIQGGTAGCVGGGGGGGGGGVNAPGGANAGGGLGGPADHGGGEGGMEGATAWLSQYFGTTANQTHHTGINGSASLTVTYNNDYWTAGPGGGGAGGVFDEALSLNDAGNPTSATITVGSGGAGVSMGGQTEGSSQNGGTGYAKLQIGVITGYEGGQISISTGGWITSASKDKDVWDIIFATNGAGTGSQGTFKLPNDQAPTVYFRGGGGGSGATATCTIQNNKVTGFTVTNGGTNYTEEPLVHVLGGSGGGCYTTATIDPASKQVTALSAPSGTYNYDDMTSSGGKYLRFGGVSIGGTQANGGGRWAIMKAVDTTDVEFFSVKAARGNGMNGGDYSEEVLQVKYQLAGQSNWQPLGIIIDGSQSHNDAFLGPQPAVDTQTTSGNPDGDSGNTIWRTWTINVPQPARAAGTKFMLEQPLPTAAGTNDTGQDKDHYGIVEVIYWKGVTTKQVFVKEPGAITKSSIDSLNYTISGENNKSYTSGISAAEGQVTLKRTTKIEPVASINPDKDIPLLEGYRTTKYLIKSF